MARNQRGREEGELKNIHKDFDYQNKEN